MAQVASRDGTPIVYQQEGQGPPLVLVDGALCHRGFGPGAAIARALVADFAVIRYDRRGRGESGEGGAWTLEREVEDLAALLAAEGPACVLGVSSGGALALAAAAAGVPIARLAVYEPPFVVDGSHPPMPPDFLPRLRATLAAGQRGDAVKAFMELVGAPGFAIALMRVLPVWKKLCAVAHTLPNDLAIVEPHYQGRPFPDGHWDGVHVPALVLYGGKSPAYLKASSRALAAALPGGRAEELPRQSHIVKPRVLARALVPFFTESVHASHPVP